MRARVDGESVSITDLSLRCFGFGEPHPRIEPRGYCLEVPIEAVVDHLGEVYEEMSQDDLREGGTDPAPMMARVRELGWPEMHTLIAEHPDVALVFIRYWAHDLVDLIFQGPTREQRFVINSIEAVKLEHGIVSLSGKVLELSLRSPEFTATGLSEARRDAARRVVEDFLVSPSSLDGERGEDAQEQLMLNLLSLEQSDLTWLRLQLFDERLSLDSRRSVSRFLGTDAGFEMAKRLASAHDRTRETESPPGPRPESVTLWAFSDEGHGFRFDDGIVTVATQRPVLDARPLSALRVGDSLYVATRAGLQVLDPALAPVAALDFGGPVHALSALPAIQAVAVGHPRGGAVMFRRDVEGERGDYWHERIPAMAVCPADEFTRLPDAVLWGTAAGHLYMKYDDNSRLPEERLGGLVSPHDGSITALTPGPHRSLYVATQGGGIWHVSESGDRQRVATTQGLTIALVPHQGRVLAFLSGGTVVAIEGGSATRVVRYDAQIRSVTRCGDVIFAGLADGSIACPLEPTFSLPQIGCAVAALCA